MFEFLNPNNLAGAGSSIVVFLKFILTALLYGVVLAVLIILLIRPLFFKYRAIIIEKRAGDNIGISVDRAKFSKKHGVEKTKFANRKGSMAELPYKYLFPTVKKGMFDLFAPKDSFILYSYGEGQYVPVDITQDTGNFKFSVEDSNAEFWRSLERKSVEAKYAGNWLKQHAGILIVSATLITGMTIILIMFIITTKG